MSPSLHGVPGGAAGCRQPMTGSHRSLVQGLLSAHAALLGVLTQPLTGSDMGLAGLHTSVVQATLSLQAALLGVFTQPVAVQVSIVQLLLSLQAPLSGVCTHMPVPLQASTVHATPSEAQGVPALAFMPGTQPVSGFELPAAGLQRSMPLPTLPSSYTESTGVCSQPKAVQVSVVQVLLSLQRVLSGVCRHMKFVPEQ